MYKVINELPWPQLEGQLHEVHLLQPRGGEFIYPYENAQITLEDISYDSVRPTSLYVLKSHLDVQRQLAADLSQQGHDPLSLSGLLTVQHDNGDPLGLMPPLIEETEEDGRYELDGLHRSYLGWKVGRLAFRAIIIRGIRADCPAAARPNEWTEVVEYESVPTDLSLKRRYRIANYLSLRRDFSALNGSQPRLG